jgi:aerobic carbon-monoxide dehydrogenase medium subunit
LKLENKWHNVEIISSGFFALFSRLEACSLTPKQFEYYSPTTLGETIELLKTKEEPKVLAGGQSLLALMKLRLAAPKNIIDITKLQGMSYIREEKDYLAIGALTIHDLVEHNQVIRDKFSLLSDAASKIGDQQIRNRGTIGGSTCHADPAADLPTALLAANASFVVEGPKGKREIAPKDMFVDVFTTAVEHDEVLTEIKIPNFPLHSGSGYIKHSRREGDFAITSCGVVVTMEGNRCADVRISLGSVASTPIRFKNAEEFLKGKTLDDKTIMEGSLKEPDGADPPSDMHGSREYRMEMIKVFTRRSLKLAMSRVK